jgi:hypothetical protein
MHRLYIISFCFILMSLSGITAHAQEDATTSDPIVPPLATSSEPVSTSTTPLPPPTTALEAIAQIRITNLAANMSNRMEAVASRFEQVAQRIDSRIQKVSYEGGDTGAAANYVGIAREHLASFRLTFANIDNEISRFVGSPHPREEWSDIKAIYEKANSDLLATHEALKQSIEILTNPPQPAPTATSTSPLPVTE